MLRIFLEALSNIVRHAHARRVWIEVRGEADNLFLTVTDNGRSITDQEIASRTSLGLLGMREQALLLGGQVSIVGRAGEGTTVTAQIPFGTGDLSGCLKRAALAGQNRLPPLARPPAFLCRCSTPLKVLASAEFSIVAILSAFNCENRGASSGHTVLLWCGIIAFIRLRLHHNPSGGGVTV